MFMLCMALIRTPLLRMRLLGMILLRLIVFRLKLLRNAKLIERLRGGNRTI